MELIFRNAVQSEFELVISLLNTAAKAINAKGLTQWNVWLSPSEEKIAWVQEGFDQNEFQLVENNNGEIVGMFRLSETDKLYWGHNEDNAAYVHSLVVKKEFSGLDLGKKILIQIEADLVKENRELFRLDCNAENEWLCQYYEQQGFVKVRQIKMPQSLNNLYEKRIIEL